jgi:tRNA modification GTPase
MSTEPPRLETRAASGSGPCEGTWRVSLLTPPGRGAIAVIAFTGPADVLDCPTSADGRAGPLFLAARGLPVAALPLVTPCVGRWGAPGSAAEDVVLVRRVDNRLEVHCHGGRAAAERILGDLETAGAEVVSWFDDLVAYRGLIHAELVEALSRATTWQATARLLTQQNDESGLVATLTAVREALLSKQTEALGVLITRLRAIAARAAFGEHLAQPWQVVLAGPPNVGKSSLLNALLGYHRAIVSPLAGTTRDVVTAETAIEGLALRLADTAGLRETAEPLERSGIELTREQLVTADLTLWLVDLSIPETSSELTLPTNTRGPVLVVAHKCDRPALRPIPDGAVRASSLTGVGLPELLTAIHRALVPDEPEPECALTVSPEQTLRLKQLLEQVVHGDDRAALELLDNWLLPRGRSS